MSTTKNTTLLDEMSDRQARERKHLETLLDEGLNAPVHDFDDETFRAQTDRIIANAESKKKAG